MEPQVPHGPEAFSFWTHVGGAVLAAAGLVALVAVADDLAARAAVGLYGATLVLLFTSSALHHTFPHATPVRKAFLRRLDHVAIYLLIAGTYTPVCVLALPAEKGLPVLVLVWAFAVVGIALKLFAPMTRRGLTAALYIAMGWMAVFVADAVWTRFDAGALALLLGGGLVYTGGAVVYARRRPDPWPDVVGFHGLWHVCVLLAAGLHFAFVLAYVVP